jgi:hypothetical protein
MTLQEFFNLLGENPIYVVFFFFIIPFAAFMAGILGRGEGHLAPWKYLYSVLIYLVSIPGVFAVFLFLYQFFFDRKSIMQADVLMEILPVLSMVITLLIIKGNVNLDYIPGFGKLSGLILMITAVMAVFWILDRTRIWVVSFVRFEYIILLFVGLLLIIRFGWKRLFGSPAY